MIKRNFPHLFIQLPGIWFAHIRETRTQLIIIRTNQRVVLQEVNVISEQHQAPFGEIQVHSATCIGDQQVLHSQ